MFFLSFLCSPPITHSKLTPTSAAIGALMGGYVMDRFGRKIPIQIGAAVAAIGAAIQSGSVSLGMMLAGRIIAGWAVGILSMSVPVYQGECAPPEHRGLIIGMAQQMIGVGFFVSAWIGYGCNHAPASSTFQWRFPLAFQCLPASILAVGMLAFPESPRYLVSVGRYEEGYETMMKLHFNGSNQEVLDDQFNEMKNVIVAEREMTAPGWTAMFTVPQWRKRLLIGTLVQVFTQTTGTNVINYYQTTMYRNLGIKGDMITLMACIYNMVGPITNLFFIIFLIDRVGRRKPLLFGTVAIMLCLLLEGICNSQNVDGSHKGLSGVGVLWIFLVSVFFSLSFGPISWTYMSEVMPMQIRSTGVAFATGIGNWAISTMWAQVSPKGLGQLGWKYYFVFVAINVGITFPTVYFFFPETKQKTLEEIDNLFGGHIDTAEVLAKKQEKLKQDTTTVEHVPEV